MPFSAKTSGLALALLFASGALAAPTRAQSLTSPHNVRAFFTAVTGGKTVVLVWTSGGAESSPDWMGYRVRRTIKGISPGPLEVIGEYKTRDTVTGACVAAGQPCDP